MNRFVSLAAAGLFSLGLAACGGGDKGAADPAEATATPDAALKSATSALRQNVVSQFVKLVLPPSTKRSRLKRVRPIRPKPPSSPR